MYHPGKGVVLATTTTVVATTAMPQTGMDTATHLAVAALAGLAAWALIYVAQSFFRH